MDVMGQAAPAIASLARPCSIPPMNPGPELDAAGGGEVPGISHSPVGSAIPRIGHEPLFFTARSPSSKSHSHSSDPSGRWHSTI